MEREWPLTGRDAELRAITAALRPPAAGVLVAGPAGVGKTRLAREAVARAEVRGARVVRAHGSRAARPFPLGAFAGLVDLPTDAASPAVSRVLDHLAGPGPLVVAVDDAHLLDELSAVVLHRVVLRGLGRVVVTVRDGEPAPDTVTALWKDDLLPRLDLDPLDGPTTAALVARVLRGPVESSSAHRLWALTRGSPLYLRHLLAGEVAAGRLTPASGIWRWSGDARLSPGLVALLEGEIGALAPPVQEVLDLVTLGEPLALGTLAGPGGLVGTDAVEEAEARALVRTEPGPDGPVVRLAHPLYGEVRRAALGTLRARRLRGLLATRLDGDAHPIPRAVLLLDSDLGPDPALYLRAARSAIGLHDLPLAERLAAAAVAAGGGWEARLVHASALSWLSRGEEAEATLADLARAAPTGPLRALAHAHRAGNLLWTLRRADDARAVLAAALAAPDAGPARDGLEAVMAGLDAATGDTAAALARALPLRRRGVPDPLVVLVAESAVVGAAAVGGRLDLLDDVVRAGGTARFRHGIPVFGLADLLLLGFRLAGVPDVGRAATADLVASSADLAGPAHLMGLVLAGHAALAVGRPAQALLPLREAWAGFEGSRHEFRFRCRTLLATCLALTGRAEAARPLVDALAAERHPAYALLEPDDLLARAWGAAAEGATSEATRHAEAAAALARDRGYPAYEVLAWQTATQLGGSDGAVAALESLGVAPAGTPSGTRGPRLPAALAHARAWAAHDPDGLAAVAATWERLGDLVAAGDAAAQAADVLRRAGRPGSALAAAARAQRLAERSGARTPALATALRPLPLTPREREVVVLAAAGLTNREIAGRLTVSVRTVEGHLYRAGHKLDVSDRAELAAILGPGGTGSPDTVE